MSFSVCLPISKNPVHIICLKSYTRLNYETKDSDGKGGRYGAQTFSLGELYQDMKTHEKEIFDLFSFCLTSKQQAKCISGTDLLRQCFHPP